MTGRVLALATLTLCAAASAAIAATSARGPRWVASSPIPANADPNDAVLAAVSCPPVGRCVAVGAYHDLSVHGYPLLVTGAAGKWTPHAGPVPAGTTPDGSILSTISCPQAGDCVAVGVFDDASDVQRGLIATEKAGKWTSLEAPLPPDAMPTPPSSQSPSSLQITSISCASPGSCVAVGSYRDENDVFHGLILRKAAGTWRAAKAPLPASAVPNGQAGLLSVSCPRSGGCVAVGWFTPKKSGRTGLILRQSHGAWQATVAPFPAGARGVTGGFLQSVSCPAAGRCTAVGSYQSLHTADPIGLLLDQAHGKWRATKVAAPPNRSVQPASVFCTAPGRCVAVGSWATPSNRGLPLIVPETAGRWGKAIHVSLPSDFTSGAYLNAVSCGSPGYCAAGGKYSANTWRGLLLSEVAGRWHAVAAPLPGAGPIDSSLASAACSPHRGCVAVGTYDGTHALLERTTGW